MDANLKEQRLSFGEIGFRLTIISILAELLASWLCKKNVSLELRNGTCFFSLRALITSASALRLLLIA